MHNATIHLADLQTASSRSSLQLTTTVKSNNLKTRSVLYFWLAM